MSRVTLRTLVAVLLAVAVAVGVVILLSIWDLKTLIGWRALVDYIDPEDATTRKDAIQVYAVLVAGMVAIITAMVGLVNLRLTRKSLVQQRALEVNRAQEQRDLEEHRAQSTALQAYYEQMGKLLIEHDLGNTERDDIRLLARAQTLSVLEGLEPSRKSRLLRFLIGSELVQERDQEDLPIIGLWGADLSGADLSGADLSGANLSEANLQRADLSEADLREANLSKAKATEKQLDNALSLEGAIMPNGSRHT
jgi:hypothetical protein